MPTDLGKDFVVGYVCNALISATHFQFCSSALLYSLEVGAVIWEGKVRAQGAGEGLADQSSEDLGRIAQGLHNLSIDYQISAARGMYKSRSLSK